VALLAAEPGREEDLDEVPRQIGPDDPRSKAQDVQVVVFDALACGIGVVADRRPDARELAGGDAHPDRAAADQEAPVGATGEHRFGHRAGAIGVVDRLRGVGSQIEDVDAVRAEAPDQVALELHSRVIRGDGDVHLTSTSAEVVNGRPLEVPWKVST